MLLTVTTTVMPTKIFMCTRVSSTTPSPTPVLGFSEPVKLQCLKGKVLICMLDTVLENPKCPVNDPGAHPLMSLEFHQ